MNIEFNNFQYAFGNFTSCLNDLNEIEYKGIKKVKFWVWHIFGLGNPKIVFSNVMAQESRNKKPI